MDLPGTIPAGDKAWAVEVLGGFVLDAGFHGIQILCRSESSVYLFWSAHANRLVSVEGLSTDPVQHPGQSFTY